MSKFGVAIEFHQDGPPIAGARVVTISGPPEPRVEAVLALVDKVDELRARLAGGASVSAASSGTISAAVSTFHGSEPAPLPANQGQPAPWPSPSSWQPLEAAGSGVTPLPTAQALGSGSGNPAIAWPVRTPAERALLAGIQASGVLNHQLTMRIPRGLLASLDVEELARRSGGARLEVAAQGVGEADPTHCFVTVVGQRISTSLATLYLQEKMAQQGLA